MTLLRIGRLCRVSLVVAAWSLSFAALAQYNASAVEAAADRYLKAVPMEKMLNDTIVALSKQVPPEQRNDFQEKMRNVLRADALEKIARKSMIKNFSEKELNALADFYGSEHGASAMQKFGTYMADVMPAIQAEVKRGLDEIGLGEK